jgi:hypothetical protein
LPWKLPNPIFLAYLVPLDVEVTGNITAKLCEVWSEFNIFCTLVTMAKAAILNFFNPPKAAKHYDGYSYKVSRCHGNGQNSKKLKNTKMIIAGYSPNRK